MFKIASPLHFPEGILLVASSCNPMWSPRASKASCLSSSRKGTEDLANLVKIAEQYALAALGTIALKSSKECIRDLLMELGGKWRIL